METASKTLSKDERLRIRPPDNNCDRLLPLNSPVKRVRCGTITSKTRCQSCHRLSSSAATAIYYEVTLHVPRMPKYRVLSRRKPAILRRATGHHLKFICTVKGLQKTC